MSHNSKLCFIRQLFFEISNRAMVYLHNPMAAQADKTVTVPQRMQHKAVLACIRQKALFRQSLLRKIFQDTVNRREIYLCALLTQLLINILGCQHTLARQQQLQNKLSMAGIFLFVAMQKNAINCPRNFINHLFTPSF